MALFKISKGNSSNLPTNKVDGYCYVTLDEHKLYVDYTNSDNELDRFALNAVRADTAAEADKLSVNTAGSSTRPVYFSGGIPSACTSLDLNTSGYAQKTYIAYSTTAAATAAKVASTTGNVTFPTTITEGTRVSVWFQYGNTAASPTLKVGTSNAIAIIPTTVTWDAGQTLDFVYDGNAWAPIEAYKAAYATKANNANSATSATQAGKLTTTTAGDASTPVYFSGGIPTVCTSLSLNTTGNAATATTLETSRNLTIMDYSLTYEGGVQPFDGSEDIILEMPAEFEGTLHGNADTATKLATARTITLAGDLSGAAKFDGSGDISISAAVKDDSHNHVISNIDSLQTTLDSKLSLSGGTMTGVITGKTELASARLQGQASGYHQIFINSANAWMTAFTIRVYQQYKWSDIVISGYNYGDSYWYSPSAIMMGSSTETSITVTFGYTSASNLWVAIPAGNYYGIEIIDCVNGYVAFDSWKDLFTISNVSTLSGTAQTTITATRPWYRGDAVTGAVWNDYAECRESNCQEAGYVLSENGDDTLSKSNERLVPFAGVSSDTWGFSQGETEKAKTHIAVAGRVLVYPYQDRNKYKPGDCVCAAPGGTVDIMTREEVREWPDRIVGIVSCVPEYEEWGGGKTADRDPVKVNGRIWIKVK